MLVVIVPEDRQQFESSTQVLEVVSQGREPHISGALEL